MNPDPQDEITRLRLQLHHATIRIDGLEKHRPLNKSTKEAIVLFFVQVLMFSVLCVNFRAIASAHYHHAAISDFIIASLQFFVIKRIADSDQSIKHWAGYALGSVAGSYVGIYISTKL